MKTRMIGAMALGASLAAAVAMVSSTALAHGSYDDARPAEQGHGPMMGQDHGPMMRHGHGPMMGHGYGPMARRGHGRMMGQGCGSMMGQGGKMGQGGMMDHGAMMGYGGKMGQGGKMGHGSMMGQGGIAPLAEDLSVDQVRHMMEHRVAMMQNPNLKLGEVAGADDDTITADVVTRDGSLVRRYTIDRHTGAMRPADMSANKEQ